MDYDDYESSSPGRLAPRQDDLQRLANSSMQEPYMVEYAKSGRSACKGRQPCKGTLIGDGEFGQLELQSERAPSSPARPGGPRDFRIQLTRWLIDYRRATSGSVHRVWRHGRRMAIPSLGLRERASAGQHERRLRGGRYQVTRLR